MDRAARLRAVVVVVVGLPALALVGCSRSSAGATPVVPPPPIATIAASVDHTGPVCRLFVEAGASSSAPIPVAASNLTSPASTSASVSFALVSGGGDVAAQLGTVGAGDRATRRVTLTAGDYTARCTIDGALVDSDARLVVR